MVDFRRAFVHLGVMQPSENLRGLLSELSNIALFVLIGYLSTIKFLDSGLVGALLAGYATARWSTKQANGAALAMTQIAGGATGGGSGGSGGGTGTSGRMGAVRPSDDGGTGGGASSGGGSGSGYGEQPAVRPGSYRGPGDINSRRDVLGVMQWLWFHPGTLAWCGTLAAIGAFIALRALKLR